MEQTGDVEGGGVGGGEDFVLEGKRSIPLLGLVRENELS